MIDKKLSERVDEYIASHRDEIIDNLRALVEIPSIRGEELPDAPFGIESDRALVKSMDMFSENGFESRIAKSRKYGIAEFGQGEKTLGLFGHCDVVTADGEWLYGEPFKLTERDGFLVGRGCNDDKSGILEMLYAAKMIKELDIPIKNRLLFFVGACEEDGMDDIADFEVNEEMPDVSLVPDGEYPYYCAEKSLTRLMLESCTPFENIKDINGGKCYNVILSDVDVTYVDGSEVAVSGISGHAGRPEGSINAFVKYVESALTDSRPSDSDKEILKAAYDILADYYGGGLDIALDDPFWGRNTCVNGMVSVNNGKLCISLDMRYNPVTSTEELMEKIHKRIDGKWNITESIFKPGYRNDEESKIALTLRNVYSALSGNECDCGIMTAGGTYSKYLRNSFPVGTVMPHPELNHGFKPGHGGVHAPDETMSEIGFLEAIKTLLFSITEIDKIL